jgi:hypothetical protein
MRDDDVGDDRLPTPKTLLPELLPAPGGAVRATDAAGAGPKERVAARARAFLERFRGIGTAAAAAAFSVHCSGYTVVDPLPPPPQQCSMLNDPFIGLSASAVLIASADGGSADGGSPQLDLILSSSAYPRRVGYRIDAARVTGGTLLRVEDTSTTVLDGGSQLTLVIAIDAVGAQLLVEVDVGCGAATTTRYYQVLTGPGYALGAVVIEQMAPVDAGAGD